MEIFTVKTADGPLLFWARNKAVASTAWFTLPETIPLEGLIARPCGAPCMT